MSMRDQYPWLGERLRSARLLTNTTQARFAQATGLSQPKVCQLEKGHKTFVPTRVLVFMAQHNINLNTIFKNEGSVGLVGDVPFMTLHLTKDEACCAARGIAKEKEMIEGVRAERDGLSNEVERLRKAHRDVCAENEKLQQDSGRLLRKISTVVAERTLLDMQNGRLRRELDRMKAPWWQRLLNLNRTRP